MLKFNFVTDDLLEMRFAFSPMWETMLSFRVLNARCPGRNGKFESWIEDARIRLQDLNLPFLNAIQPEGSYIADFLMPTPDQNHPTFEEELAHLRMTPEARLRHDLEYLEEHDLWHEDLDYFVRYPRESVERLADEVEQYWERVIAPHWPRMHAILEGDLLYRGRQLALGGAHALFNGIEEGHMHYDRGQLSMKSKHENRADKIMKSSKRGMVLMPTIFAGKVWFQNAPEEVPVVAYEARGVGLWQPKNTESDQPDPLERTLGAVKARLLQHLTTPSYTGELAQRLALTPGAISQQLGQLREAGLVEPYRNGRRVFYTLTTRGTQLLSVFQG